MSSGQAESRRSQDRQSRPCPIPREAGGLIAPEWCFETMAQALSSLPEDLDEDDVLRAELLLHREGRLAIYYAPFDRVNEAARIVIVGITPGQHQMYLAVQQARRDLAAGLHTDDILRRASATAAFAGSMRRNLVRMLDEIGIPTALGIKTSDSLFSDHQELLASTSAIVYCVVRDGRNYSGSSPTISRSPILREFATEVLGRVLAATQGALVVPLGRYATEAVHLAVAAKGLPSDHCLIDFPHPSGGNGHRVRLFNEHRAILTSRVADWSSSA